MEQQIEKVDTEVKESAHVQRLNLNKVKKTMKPLEKKGLIFAALMLLIPFINFLLRYFVYLGRRSNAKGSFFLLSIPKIV